MPGPCCPKGSRVAYAREEDPKGPGMPWEASLLAGDGIATTFGNRQKVAHVQWQIRAY